MQEILYIVALSLGSIGAIFILTKLMGYRQMSQMSMFDYITGITIGSIAAEMATSLEENFMQPLVAMVVYAFVTMSLSFLSTKSIKARKILEGSPIILLHGGELYLKNLKKAKIDVNEFLMQCRVNGYFDLSKVQTVILEGNGKLSILPKETDRPATPADFYLSPQQEFMVANVIIDGKIMRENLRHAGKDEKWLLTHLKTQGASGVEEVVLATCSMDGKLTVFLKEAKGEPGDVLI